MRGDDLGRGMSTQIKSAEGKEGRSEEDESSNAQQGGLKQAGRRNSSFLKEHREEARG